MSPNQNGVKLICPLLGNNRECIMFEEINNKTPFPPFNRCTFYYLNKNHWDDMLKYPEKRESVIEDCKFLNPECKNNTKLKQPRL